MSGMKRLRFWFLILSIQLILAVVVPTAVLYMLPARDMASNLKIPGLTISQLPLQDAIEQTQSFYKNIVSQGAIVFEGRDKQVQIPYSSIGLQFDTAEVLNELGKSRYQNRLFELIGKADSIQKQVTATPYMNEALFKDELSVIQQLCHREPENARMVLQQEGVSVSPSADGCELDVDKALQYTTEQLQINPSEQIILSENRTPWLFTATGPQITTEKLQKFTQIYSLVQSTIPDEKTEALYSLLQPLDNTMIQVGDTFSFRQCISLFKGTDPLQQLLASSIYQAILPVGELRVLNRKAANQPIPGIEPGLEVSLEGDGDLQFKNTASIPLMLIFQLDQDGRFSTALVGQPGLNPGVVRAEHTKIQPSVIYSQQNNLPKDAQEVLEPGRDGLAVTIYRMTGDEAEELYEDVYQPVHKIIAVGTGVKKKNIIFK
ncbi:MAG: G5 domain-containing protein [Thermoclostridium sp.]|nr:G5 domain-containing protein [Thermoclostridium sp.]